MSEARRGEAVSSFASALPTIYSVVSKHASSAVPIPPVALFHSHRRPPSSLSMDGDLFGSDSEEDTAEDLSLNEEQRCIFSLLCERKLFLKEPEDPSTSSSPFKPRDKIRKTLLIVCKDEETSQILTQKLRTLHPIPSFTLSYGIDEDEEMLVSYDIIVDLTAASDDASILNKTAKAMYTRLVPGGLYIYVSDGDLNVELQHAWCPLHGRTVTLTRKDTVISVLRKALVLCNSTGAVYWASDNVHNEECLLSSITVPLSTEERKRSILSVESHNSAVDILRGHGVCVIRGLFDSEDVKYFGDQSLKDLEMAMEVLKNQKGIDLEKPGEEGQPIINNFHELSMREALRCDLRNGKYMTEASQKYKESYDRLQHNPYVVKMLKEAMHQHGADESGNWGRWNFEGKGPQSGPPDIKAGKMGTIISIPGCGDQTIHADTSHIFVHTQLPAHYINMFMIATGVDSSETEIDLSIGQTAYVAGSHFLNVSKAIMVDQDIDELTKRLVRPHLEPGDAIFFDCRILHFGLANQSNTGYFPSSLSHRNLYIRSKRLGEARMKIQSPISSDYDPNSTNTPKKNSSSYLSSSNASDICLKNSTFSSIEDLNLSPINEVLSSCNPTSQRRAILYVNYTHTWFHDPKNWNDAERLF